MRRASACARMYLSGLLAYQRGNMQAVQCFKREKGGYERGKFLAGESALIAFPCCPNHPLYALPSPGHVSLRACAKQN